MKTGSFNVIGYDVKYWWLLLSGGVLFIGLGIWIIFSPEKTYLFLSLLLAIGMLTTGLFEALFSLIKHKYIKGWGWIFVGGIIDSLLGIYLINYPLLTMIVMPLVMGIWMLFRAFIIASSPINLKAVDVGDWIWLLSTSVVLILPSVIIFIDPFFGLVNIVIWTGFAFIISGIFRIYFSQQLRKLKGLNPKREKKITIDYNHDFV